MHKMLLLFMLSSSSLSAASISCKRATMACCCSGVSAGGFCPGGVPGVPGLQQAQQQTFSSSTFDDRARPSLAIVLNEPAWCQTPACCCISPRECTETCAACCCSPYLGGHCVGSSRGHAAGTPSAPLVKLESKYSTSCSATNNLALPLLCWAESRAASVQFADLAIDHREQ
jgi:hypothetical protein